MEKITINDVVFCNFGSNNYSEGMELVSSYPCNPQLVEDVLLGRYSLGERRVFLNPSAPCGSEFFGVLGTEEQYKNLYKEQRDAQIAKKVLSMVDMGASDEQWREAQRKAEEEYQDWWDKSNK